MYLRYVFIILETLDIIPYRNVNLCFIAPLTIITQWNTSNTIIRLNPLRDDISQRQIDRG